MSLDLNIYVKQVEDSIIPKWMSKFHEVGMKVDIHPSFTFKNYSGFLPFKIEMLNQSNLPYKSKILLSGFQLFIQDFNLQSEKDKLKPKKSFFQKMLSGKEQEVIFAGENIDLKLDSCKKLLIINWSTADTLELRMSMLSAAILSQLLDGVCCYPNDNLWYENDGLLKKFEKDVNEYELGLKPENWELHDFEVWN